MLFINHPPIFNDAYKEADASIKLIEARLKQLSFHNRADMPEYERLLKERERLERVKRDALPKYYKLTRKDKTCY
jgi:hypothetical protein